MKQLLILSAALVFLSLTACRAQAQDDPESPEETEAQAEALPEALIGTWTASGQIGDGGMSWMKEITLSDHGGYAMQGYPPITATAKASLESTGDRTWNITLSERIFNGSPADDVTWPLILAEDGASFEMRGETYTKQQPAEP